MRYFPPQESPEETQQTLPWYGEKGKEVHPVTGAIRADWLQGAMM